MGLYGLAKVLTSHSKSMEDLRPLDLIISLFMLMNTNYFSFRSRDVM